MPLHPTSRNHQMVQTSFMHHQRTCTHATTCRYSLSAHHVLYKSIIFPILNLHHTPVLRVQATHLTDIPNLFQVHHALKRTAAAVLRVQATHLTHLIHLFRVHHTLTRAACTLCTCRTPHTCHRPLPSPPHIHACGSGCASCSGHTPHSLHRSHRPLPSPPHIHACGSGWSFRTFGDDTVAGDSGVAGASCSGGSPVTFTGVAAKYGMIYGDSS